MRGTAKEVSDKVLRSSLLQEIVGGGMALRIATVGSPTSRGGGFNLDIVGPKDGRSLYYVEVKKLGLEYRVESLTVPVP